VIRMLVVTHGRLGEELVLAARKILPESAQMDWISIGWEDDLGRATSMIEDSVASLAARDGIIIVTDMLGGTPANVAMAFLEPGRVEVITGVNLPMLIKFNNLDEDVPLSAAAAMIAEKGMSHITVAGDLLERGGGA